MQNIAKSLALLGVASVSICGCVFIETYEISCLTKTECADNIERGWIPDWIPDDAANIFEIHNIDSNRGLIRFNSTKNGILQMVNDKCKDIEFTQFSPPLVFTRKWNIAYRNKPTTSYLCVSLSSGFKFAFHVWVYENNLVFLERTT